MSVPWRVFAVNAAVLAVATRGAGGIAGDVSVPLAVTEAIVLSGGLVVLLVVNFLLRRRAMRSQVHRRASDCASAEATLDPGHPLIAICAASQRSRSSF